jgi:predicted ArsR family transcriptional regulator
MAGSQMFHPAFRDLLKPQWLATLAELKVSGGLAVSDLSRQLDTSYMTVKQHCEDLTKLGYLKRSRVPRTGIGRPEIFYRLSEKADAMFPGIPEGFTLDVLDQIQRTFGETAPDRLLFQHFQERGEEWKARLSKGTTLLYKAQLFAKIRSQEGLFLRCLHDPETGVITLREFHHPLARVFAKHPRTIEMERRAIEVALGVRVSRTPGEGVGDAPPHIDFTLATA